MTNPHNAWQRIARCTTPDQLNDKDWTYILSVAERMVNADFSSRNHAILGDTLLNAIGFKDWNELRDRHTRELEDDLAFLIKTKNEALEKSGGKIRSLCEHATGADGDAVNMRIKRTREKHGIYFKKETASCFISLNELTARANAENEYPSSESETAADVYNAIRTRERIVRRAKKREQETEE